MYKVIWLVRFRRDVPREDVLAWWRGPHAALAAATPGMVRYVQSHWLAPLDPATCLPRAGESSEFDGHAEHWFESREAYDTAMASEEWALTRADGSSHFDSSTLVGGALEETVVLWDAANGG
jgi:uncharacterized protein (TIGR02118 family)